MNQTADRVESLSRVWNLVKNAHSALLVNVAEEGSPDSRPIGCVQHAFYGTICLSTLRALRN